MSQQTMPYSYFKGEIIPSEKATVSIASNSLQYGTTCFAGIRGYVRAGVPKVFRLEDHHARLMNASKIMGMNFFIEYKEFLEIISNLISVNAPKTDFYIRPFIFAQTEQISPRPVGLKFELAIYMIPMKNYYDPEKGLRLMVSSWRKFSDTALPTKSKTGGCYVNSFMASGEAARCGYDEALLMDQEGYIVEASVANLLVRYRDKLIIPELGNAQLEGITMRTVIDLLKDEGMPVSFERIDRSMIYCCDELLLMGTAAQISFAESVDNRSIGIMDQNKERKGPGKICQFLRKKYEQLIDGSHARSQEWVRQFDLADIPEINTYTH